MRAIKFIYIHLNHPLLFVYGSIAKRHSVTFTVHFYVDLIDCIRRQSNENQTDNEIHVHDQNIEMNDKLHSESHNFNKFIENRIQSNFPFHKLC